MEPHSLEDLVLRLSYWGLKTGRCARQLRSEVGSMEIMSEAGECGRDGMEELCAEGWK